MTITQLLERLPGPACDVVTTLHDTAVAHGCAHRIDPLDDQPGHRITYSVRDFAIEICDENVTFTGVYDIRAFLRLYRSTDARSVRQLMFNAAIPCCYCTDDKCTTLLMARERTIEFDGRRKKLCGPYRHSLRIKATPENLPACREIADMMFAYTTPRMHRDLFYENTVTHTVAHRDQLRVIGYVHTQNAFSVSTEAFVERCLAAREDGTRPVDELLRSAGMADTGEYIGVTLNFRDGANYEFLFGIVCDRFPGDLPENAGPLKIGAGDWAMYNSSAGEYPSVWRDFTDHFYDREQMGYDLSRVPFEYYDAAGHFRDVHIPVDADCARDSAKFVRLIHTPDLPAVGYRTYQEHDYPLYRELDFDPYERLLELFPLAERTIVGYRHADLGKPESVTYAVETDRQSAVPNGLDAFTIRGGYWHLEGRRHFNGGSCGWPTDQVPGNPEIEIGPLAHPRLFIEFRYRSRGGHSETAVPVRVRGELQVDLVTRPPCRILGRQENPPDSCLTDEWIEGVLDLDENPEPGSWAYAFTYALRGKKKALRYFDRPVTVGFLAGEDTPVPVGCAEYRFPGGKYLKYAESLPNGEYNWDVVWYTFDQMEGLTGHKPDLERSFFVHQKGYGREFVCYIPVV
jgi:hypothetical protein